MLRAHVPAYVRSRVTGKGKRYDVIYRRGGRYTKVEHAGTFGTQREAQLRKRTVEDWLASGKNPRVELARAVAQDMDVRAAGEAWLASRRAIADDTRDEYARRVRRLGDDFPMQARDMTVKDVNDWIDRLELKPATVREYLATLRAILDHAGVDNVARDRRVEAPRIEKDVLEVPDATTTLRVLARAHDRYREILVLIEQAGLRVSEACALPPGHVDRAGGRILIGKTKTRRPRWVPVESWLLERLAPPYGMTRQRVWNQLAAACDLADVDPFGPHMLRHRRASLWLAQGKPPATVAAWMGHSVKTLLDTYTHVVPVDEVEAQALAALL